MSLCSIGTNLMLFVYKLTTDHGGDNTGLQNFFGFDAKNIGVQHDQIGQFAGS